jgi:hypothetical protein
MNVTLYDRNPSEGAEDIEEGRMHPVNHTIWFRVNDTTNSSYVRNFTGDAGQSPNAVFTVTRTDITDYGRTNISYEFAVPSGWIPGRWYVNMNATDNATTFTSTQIYDNSTYILVTGEGVSEELLDEDGVDQNINLGYWGNVTLTPGASNTEFTTNYIRIENTGSYNTQQVTVNFDGGTTWASAKTGDSITIDTNIEWTGCWTNTSTDNPGNSFVTEGSTWIAWQSDTTGSYEFQFYATGEYIWVKIRIITVPSPLSGSDDYTQTYTVTTSGVG